MAGRAPVGRGDHPRIRGEHGGLYPEPDLAVGSSPHTRGARDLGVDDDQVDGIIPAYAGSTGARAGEGLEDGDHPRIRGEHAPLACPLSPWGGSSPHTRGAPAGIPVQGATGRIIPAYAGSTA